MRRKPMHAATRFNVWRRDGFRCAYCGRDAISESITLEVDHIVPVSEGGSDDLSNLATACKPCNWKKGPHPGRTAIGITMVRIVVPTDVDERIRATAQRRGETLAAAYRRLMRLGIEADERQERVNAPREQVPA